MGAILASYFPPAPAPHPLPTDAELLAGKADRDANFDKVQAYQRDASNNIPLYRQVGLETTSILFYQKAISDEVAWWTSKPLLTKVQALGRITQFEDTIDPMISTLNQQMADGIANMPEESRNTIMPTLTPTQQELVNAAIAQNRNQASRAVVAATATEKSKTFKTNVFAGASSALIYVLKVLYVLMAIRVGIFAATDLLYKPLGYRVIGFIYAALLAPVMLIYYLYRIYISNFPVHYYSFFPLYKNSLISFATNKYLFGYPDEIEPMLQNSRQQYEMKSMSVLQNTYDVLNDLTKQREKRFEESKAK